MDIYSLKAPRLTLNDDEWMEILLSLPAKSLTRFRSVCKKWLALISSDQFRRLHVLRHPKLQPSLILRTRLPSKHFYLDPLLNNPKLIPYSFTVPNSTILNASKGLLLLLKAGNPVEYYVYNPTTKQSRKISLAESNEFPKVMGLTLAFDPSESPNYKIVCVRAKKECLSYRERLCQIQVYDSQTHTWRLCLESFTSSMGAWFPSGVHWNNVIYWDNYPENNLYYNINENLIGNIPCDGFIWFGGESRSTSYFRLQPSNGHPYNFIKISHFEDEMIDKFVTDYKLKKEDYSESLLNYFAPGKIEWYAFLNKISDELDDLRNRESVQVESGNVFEFGETLAPV